MTNVQVIEHRDMPAIPEAFGRYLLGLQHDDEPETGTVSYESKADLTKNALVRFHEDDSVTYEETMEALSWISSVPDRRTILLISFEGAIGNEADDGSKPANYVRCKCPQNSIKLNIPFFTTPDGRQIACTICFAEIEECQPAPDEDAIAAGLPC